MPIRKKIHKYILKEIERLLDMEFSEKPIPDYFDLSIEVQKLFYNLSVGYLPQEVEEELQKEAKEEIVAKPIVIEPTPIAQTIFNQTEKTPFDPEDWSEDDKVSNLEEGIKIEEYLTPFDDINVEEVIPIATLVPVSLPIKPETVELKNYPQVPDGVETVSISDRTFNENKERLNSVIEELKDLPKDELICYTINGKRWITSKETFDVQIELLLFEIENVKHYDFQYENIKENREQFLKFIWDNCNSDKMEFKNYSILEKTYSESLSKKIEEESSPLTEHQNSVVTTLLDKIYEIMNTTYLMTSAPAGRMVLFEGAAGTGKTFTMSYVLKILSSRYKIAMCSPTHEALGVIRNTLKDNCISFTEDPNEFSYDENIIIRTIASFLSIKMDRDLENGTESFKENLKGPILNCDILCVDECSMVSKDLIAIMIKKLGIQFKMILFIGDEPQLPSPADGEEGNGLFNLPYKNSLTQVVRQKEGSQLLSVAWWIRDFILNKNTIYKPSQLITEQIHNNNDIFFTRDQTAFINSYLNNTSTSKYIGTYTNNLTNEYNTYIRSLAISGYQNLNYEIYPFKQSLDEVDEINPELSNISFISNERDFREFYVGEYLKTSEINQIGENVIHQNGDIFRIKSLTLETYEITIETLSQDLYSNATLNTYELKYWRIIDTKNKVINVIANEYKQMFKDICSHLYQNAQRNSGKRRFAKYMNFKEKFTKVTYLFCSTLHKLQGKTCEDLYLDIRDLDKYYKNSPLTVYKLLYVALTRPTTRIHILI